MSREAITQLPTTAESSISRFSPKLHHEAGNKILNLSHVELHIGDDPIPRQELQEQHEPHVNRVRGFMGRASRLLGTAHNQLLESETEPTFSALAEKAKEIALENAKTASHERRDHDAIKSLEDLLVIEALSATEPSQRQVRSEAIFGSIKDEPSLVDKFIVASHETFGIVARHDDELVALNRVAIANERELTKIKTRDYSEDFSEISSSTYEEEKQAAFESIKSIAAPLIEQLETEAKQTGIEDTQLHARNLAQVKGALAITKGIATPHEGLRKLESRDIFISHSFFASRKEALQLSLALDAAGMDPRIDNKGAGVVVMEHPEDPTYPDGPRFYTKWRNEFRDSIKDNGNGMLLLTQDALDSPVVAWEVGVMLKKNCNLVVAYDEGQNKDGQPTALEKLDAMLQDYESGQLKTPEMLEKEGGNIGEVLRAIRNAQMIKLEGDYFDDQDKLGSYIVDSLLAPSTPFPKTETIQTETGPGQTSESSQTMDEIWQDLQKSFKTLEDVVDQSPGDSTDKWRQHYKLDQAQILLAGIVCPGALAENLAKINLYSPDKLVGDGSEGSDFLHDLLQETKKLGFKLQPGDPGDTLNLLAQTSTTIKDLISPDTINEFAKFMQEKEPIFPIFIGQNIFSELGKIQPINNPGEEFPVDYLIKRQKLVDDLKDRQTLVFNDEPSQMDPGTKAIYTRLLANSLTTKFALNELALSYKESQNLGQNMAEAGVISTWT